LTCLANLGMLSRFSQRGGPTMLLSIYTYVKNGIHLDYHVVDMLKHHLPLADEIVVNEGFSTDGTFEVFPRLTRKSRSFATTGAR
jgi:hypothetical protein